MSNVSKQIITTAKSLPRTKTEREEDRKSIQNLLLTGKEALEISKILSLPIATVMADIQVISQRWEGNTPNISRAKAEQVATLRLLRKELFDAWEASKKLTKTTTSNTQSMRGDRSEVIEETTPGDPKYIELIMKNMEQEAKLCGLNSPQKVDVESKNLNVNVDVKGEVLQMIERAARNSQKNNQTIQELENTKLIGPVIDE